MRARDNILRCRIESRRRESVWERFRKMNYDKRNEEAIKLERALD